MARILGSLAAVCSALLLATATSPRAGSASNVRPPAAAAPSTGVPSDSDPAESSAFSKLPTLRIRHLGTQRSESVLLYDAAGRVDESAARRLDQLLCDARKPDELHATVLDRRTLQLLFRAAYHFEVELVEVVSAYRRRGRRREGFHGLGRAIDFKLPGIPAAQLAAYLRRQPRVGVGVYTHPRTQFVHLDNRERSYYWLDASPPGRSWRERALKSASIPVRDARYLPQDDWPEGTRPPPELSLDGAASGLNRN